MMDIKEVLTSMVYKCFDRKTSGSGIKNENILNKELAEELHKPTIRKFNKGICCISYSFKRLKRCYNYQCF